MTLEDATDGSADRGLVDVLVRRTCKMCYAIRVLIPGIGSVRGLRKR